MITEHRCIWPGCEKTLMGKVACTPHWFGMPPAIRNRLWNAFVPGEPPSVELAAAAQDLADWISAFPDQAARPYRPPASKFRRHVKMLRDRESFLSAQVAAGEHLPEGEYRSKHWHIAELRALQWALEVLDPVNATDNEAAPKEVANG